MLQIEYKNFRADLTYSAHTKTYFGEVEDTEPLIVFQATNRQHALQIIHHAVDMYLQSLLSPALL